MSVDHRCPAHDLAVDVPENEPVDRVPDLKTETSIAALALLAGRLFRKKASAVARSYNELRSQPLFGSTNDVIDRWVREQTALLLRERQVGLAQPLTARLKQFEAQLGRQIDNQLRAVGVEVVPNGRPFAPVQSGFRTGDVETARREAKMIDNSTKLIADQVTRRVQSLLEHVDTTVAQVALHNATELPAIDLTPKVKTGSSSIQRAVVDVVWTYQTAVQAVKYEAAGVRYAEWRSQRDRKVRPKHKDFDGKVYKLGVGLEGVTPGSEINCRCYPVPKRPGYKPR